MPRYGRNEDKARCCLCLRNRVLKKFTWKRSFFNITKMPFPPVTCCQNQIMCSGCKNLLIYPAGATSICCALCHAVTPVPTSVAATPCSCTVVGRKVYNVLVVAP
uniref:Zinc finger LSD1-type domain-containing protein n=1 Tax=Cucumis sativus TaxID=3659 RepID=A0A0A0L592_CUCSA